MKKLVLIIAALMSAEAYPVARVPFGDWVTIGDVSIDTDDIKTRSYSVVVKTQKNDTPAGSVVELRNANLSNKAVRVLVKSSNWAATTDFTLMFGSDKYGLSNTVTLDIKNKLVNPTDNEWVEIIAPINEFVKYGNPDLTALNLMVWQIKGDGSTQVTAKVESVTIIESLPNKQPMISITVDDGSYTTEYARLVMEKYKLAGSIYVDRDGIGEPGFLTAEQVKKFAESGWDISGHSVMVNFLTASDYEIAKSVENTSTYLKGEGFKGSNVFAYPMGVHSNRVVDSVQKHYHYGLNINGMSNSTSYVAPYNINRHSVDRWTTLEQIKGWIDNAKANNEWLIINFHTFNDVRDVDENVSLEYFESAVKMIADSQIPVMPVSDAVTWINKSPVVTALNYLDPVANKYDQADPNLVTRPYVAFDTYMSKDSDHYETRMFAYGTGVYLNRSEVDRIGVRYGTLHYKDSRTNYSSDGHFTQLTGAIQYGETGDHIIEGAIGTATVDGKSSTIGSLVATGPIDKESKINYEVVYERGLVDSEESLDRNITVDTIAVTVDKDFTDTINISGTVGASFYSDGNEKYFVGSKITYTFLPEYGLSTYLKGRYYANSDYNNLDGTGERMPYFSPEYMKEGVVGLQYRKFFPENRSVFTASVEAGRQSSDYASNDVYAAELKYESYLTKRAKWNLVVGHRNAAGGRGDDPDYKYNYIFGSIIIPF